MSALFPKNALARHDKPSVSLQALIAAQPVPTSQISAFKNRFRSLSFQSLQKSRHVRIKERMFASSDACSGQTFGFWQSLGKDDLCVV